MNLRRELHIRSRVNGFLENLCFAITPVDGFDPQNAHASHALHSEGNTWNEASRIQILMCRKILGG